MHSGSGYPPDEHSSETHVYLDLVFAFVFSILEEDREGARRRRPRDPRIFFFLRHTGLAHALFTVLWVGSGQQMRPARAQWLAAGRPAHQGGRNAGCGGAVRLLVAKREKRECVKSRESEHVVTTYFNNDVCVDLPTYV